MDIYFDNAATTRPWEGALARAEAINREIYGNPSSRHGMGMAAERAVSQAADTFRRLLNDTALDIVFTSGGTEANNLAIFGACHALAKTKRHIITNRAEHPSVLEPMRRVPHCELTYIPLSQGGAPDLHALASAITDQTALVSFAHVNSATGVIQDIGAIGDIVKGKGALFHVDAAQSFGKHPIDMRTVDLLTISAHKIYGPKGVGALAVRKGVKLSPLFYGGEQQSAIRPGTENTPGIAGFAAAADWCRANQVRHGEAVAAVKQAFLDGLRDMADIRVNGGQTSPYIANVSFIGLNAEVLLNALQERGVYASAGPACHGKKKPERVLTHYGLPDDVAESMVRFSFSCANTPAEAARCAEILKETAGFLRKFAR